MTLIGGLTDVVGVMGRFGDDVVMLEEFCVVRLELELVKVFDVDILDEELLLIVLLDDIVLELDDDLLDICVLDCCWSC